MLERKQAALVVIDVQEKLVPAMFRREALLDQVERAIRGAKALDLPVFFTEQVPAALGRTVESIRAALPGVEPFVKNSFSCCGSDAFREAVKASGRRQILVAGIESHVCVYQTVADLVGDGYRVEVLQDATTSRTEDNARLGRNRCREAGALLSSVEMALFELLRVAEGDAFRSVIQIVK